ncbi:hypothetical protein AU186_07845 [Mycobacterium sp. GA-1999]|nr:hypothetical protein AU185_23365 [Mycobacterium sp. GA-0227b]KUH92325.1 hypothetical protein AU186_07845 [Mycobacterium sp. GA-1999]
MRRIPRTRVSDGLAPNGDAHPDIRLAPMDQSLYAQHKAIGRNLVLQVVWVYEHAIDFDGVRRFHHNLGCGLLGRRIERSPLPFGRHRWASDGAPSDIDIDQRARPRAELSDWADERAQLPIDPEWGPGWHLGAVELTDGSTAVSLVMSHYLIDGIGGVVALIDAILGNTRDLGYPPPASRTRRRAVLQDARQTARDAREVGRALVVAAKMARQGWPNSAQSASRPVASRGVEGDDHVLVPGITITIDPGEWDARAKALGGTSNTLTVGLAAKLGERMGRRRAGDGAVTLQLPISDRTESDTRANAMLFARVSIDPTRVTTDLRGARDAVKQALTALREKPDESMQVLWLAPFVPKRTLKRMADSMVDPDLPVFCSNFGDLGSVVNRLDGTPAEYATARVTNQGETREWLEKMGGEMTVQSLRLPESVVISVNAYQPGAENTKPALRELAARTLMEFDLTGEID